MSPMRLAAALMLAAAAVPSSAFGVRVGHPTPVSGLHGPSGRCPGAVPGDSFPASGLEPSVAATTGRRGRVVTAWMQGAGMEARTGWSKDRGRTWRRSTPPDLSRCSGGDTDGSADVSMAVGRNRRFYLASLSFNRVRPTFDTDSRLVVSTSDDGGKAWSSPVTVVPSGQFVDHAVISADPRRPRSAYLVWTIRQNPVGQSGALYFARTDDGGRSWSAPTRIYQPLPELLLAGNGQAFAAPNGDLVVVFNLLNESSELGGVFNYPFRLLASRSTDGGRTWSDPMPIATYPSYGSRFFFKTADGYPLQVNAWPSSQAQAPDGTLYAAWAAIRKGDTQLLLSASRDGGMRWSRPRLIDDVHGQAFQPTIGVDRQGVVGVFWYDLRRDRAGDGKTPTRVLFAASGNRGRNWSAVRSGGAFDYTRALKLPGLEGLIGSAYFIGDYYGLSGLAHGFLATFGMPAPRATRDRGPVRIYAARVRVGRRR